MMNRFEDLEVGQEWVSPSRTITEADVTMFAMLSGDYDELHTSEEWCKTFSLFKTRIAHGMLGLCIVEGLKKRIAHYAKPRYGVSLGYTWKFTGPIFLGDTVHLKIRVANLRESKSKPGRAVITESVQIINQRGEMVQEGEHSILLWPRPL